MVGLSSLVRACCLPVALVLGAPVAWSAPPLPARNLLVEVRLADDGALQADALRAAGTVGVSSDGGVVGSGAVTMFGRTQRAAADALQRVLVLNGSRARLQVAQLQPLNDMDVAWTPWGRAGAVCTTWVELVDGIDVWPRWNGGDAPVIVELGAQRGATTAVAPGAPPPQTSVYTTVQVPLGQWTDIAQLQRRGSVSVNAGFGGATTARQQRLQLRVSLP